MKFVKQFFIIFFLVISVVLMIGIFMDKNYHVERTITINTPAYEVFDYIRYLKNLDAYSFWSKIDPEMKRRYEG
ncbi:MAG TPA: polyketide cyclase, partial [Saprospiraceae bacterium]|nr:polyketide cyclase [Saprospiraceae bacterium]